MKVFYEPDYLVEESILERNPRTGVIREIDIMVTSLTNPDERMMIECRDHGRKQDVQWIDALAGKSRSLGFRKTVAVSSSGFTSNALLEAEDRGIVPLHLKQAEETDWRKWLMAINEFGISVEGPELKSISFGIPTDWPGTLPGSIEISKVVLVDKRDSNIRIPLLEWVTGLLNDPKQLDQIQKLRKSNVSPPFVYTHQCSPEMGFVILGIEEFIPLVELKIHINYIVSVDKVPLEHLDLGGERILVGKSSIRGVPTQLVIHEKYPELTILLEQDQLDNNNQQSTKKLNPRKSWKSTDP